MINYFSSSYLCKTNLKKKKEKKIIIQLKITVLPSIVKDTKINTVYI